MKNAEFEALVYAAKLVPISTWSPRFIVALQITTAYGNHTEVGTIDYLPAEFATLTRDRAESQIEMVRQRLLKSATEKLRVTQ